jgi:phosphatidylglycerol:prolipoprotein diacylglycerol transferase
MVPEAQLGVPAFWLLVPWAAVVCLWMVLRVAERDGVGRWQVIAAQAAWSATAIAGAKLFAMAEAGRLLDADGVLQRGWRYSGGFVGIAIGAAIARPLLLPAVSWARYADWLAPAFAAGHAIMRVSCYLNGCCTGAVCSAGWCVSFPAGSTVAAEQYAAGLLQSPLAASLPVLPLHFLFFAAALGVAFLLSAIDPFRRFDGQTFLWFLVLHEGSKFGLEFLREPRELVLQLAAAVPAAAGLAALVATRSLRRRAPGSKP